MKIERNKYTHTGRIVSIDFQSRHLFPLRETPATLTYFTLFLGFVWYEAKLSPKCNVMGISKKFGRQKDMKRC